MLREEAHDEEKKQMRQEIESLSSELSNLKSG